MQSPRFPWESGGFSAFAFFGVYKWPESGYAERDRGVNFLRLEAACGHDTLEHVRVRLAYNDIRFTAGGVGYALSHGAAVDEDNFPVGGAHAVRICSDIGEPTGGPPCCTAQPFIGERGVKSDHEDVRAIIGIVSGQLKARLLKFLEHAGSSKDEQSLGFRIIDFDIIDCGYSSCIDFLRGGVYSHFLQLGNVIVDRACGIIREERIGNSGITQGFKKTGSPVKKLGSKVDGSIHVKRNVLDTGARLHEVTFSNGGDIRFFHYLSYLILDARS